MSQIFKNKPFQRWMTHTQLTDKELVQAVAEMQMGLVDANLGAGLFKKRIAIAGKGKRGGFRTMIASNQLDKWFFIFGFEKNQMNNIAIDELMALKNYSKILLKLTEEQLPIATQNGSLIRVHHDN